MDYERIKNAIEKSRGVGNQWTSYSDLFMSLAIVFLLLYVMLGLRSTGQEVAYHQMVQKAQEEVSQTREQMAAYASVGDDYLAQNSNAEENEVYAKVFQQLSLLEDQEKAYKERLKELSEQAADKENELSQYQKIIKNIVQANLLAKSKMQKQQQDLVAQEELVENLQENLRENQQQLQENTRQIASIEEARIGQQKELEKVLAQRKEDQSKHTQQIQAYTKEVAALEEQAAAYQAKLQKTQQEMAQQHQAAQNKYKALQDKLTAAQGVAQQERQNAEKVLAATARQKKGFEADLTRLRQQHQAALEAERAKIAQLDQEKLSAQKLAAEQKKIRENVEKVNQDFSQKIQELNANLAAAENKHLTAQNEIAKANAKYEKELAYQTSLQKENDAYRDKMNALGQELSKKQDALAAEKNQQVQLTAQLSAAHAANEKMQQENSLYAQRVAQLDQDLKKALAQIDQSKDQAGHAANLQAKLAAEKVYSEKIGQLNQKLKDELLAMKGEKNKLLQDRAALAQEVNSQRQKVAKRIKENFAKAKLKVQVDELTGEIYLDFSKNYFDYDSTRLTPGMIRILKQAIPVYAKSLFADPELAAKIKSVEIVGHASPTYQGKFVDPRSTSYQARKALNYNMDLSYRRSKEMFNYIFDQQKMKFAYQDRMFAKAKVAGRSYLNVKPPKPKGRIPASFKRKDFCKYYDCSDSQKVAITFELAE